MRRFVTLALFLAIVGASAPVGASAAHPDLFRPRAEVDASKAVVLPAHAPMPAASTGIGPGSHLLMEIQGSTFVCTANFVWTETKTTYPVNPKNGKSNKKKPIVTRGQPQPVRSVAPFFTVVQRLAARAQVVEEHGITIGTGCANGL